MYVGALIKTVVKIQTQMTIWRDCYHDCENTKHKLLCTLSFIK
jgi:hypothetical protein